MSNGNGFVTAGDLLGRTARRYKNVHLPDTTGGRDARIQSLTEREKSEYESALLTLKGEVRRSRLLDARRRLIVLCLVDSEGKRLFSDGEASKLEDIDGEVTSLLFDAAKDHCGFSNDDIEELTKNSEGIHVDDSPTA